MSIVGSHPLNQFLLFCVCSGSFSLGEICFLFQVLIDFSLLSWVLDKKEEFRGNF